MIYIFCVLLLALKTFHFPFGIDADGIRIAIAIVLPFLLIFTVIKDKFTIKKYIIPFIFLLPLVALHSVAVVIIILYAYIFHKTKIYKIINFSIFIQIIFVAISLYFLYHGYTDNIIKVRSKSVLPQQTLGISENSNATGGILSSILFLVYLLIERQRIRFVKPVLHLFNFAFMVIVYYYTGSRTWMLGGIILYILRILQRRRITNLIRVILIFPFVLMVSSLLLPILFHNNTFMYFLVSGRFFAAYKLFQEITPINLFIGRDLPETYPIDSGYIILLIQSGIIGVIFIIHVYTHFIELLQSHKSLYNKYRVYIPYIIVFFCMGLMEEVFIAVDLISFSFWLILISLLDVDISLKRKSKLKLLLCR